MPGNGGDIQIIMLRLSPRFCDVIGKRVKPPLSAAETEGIASHGITRRAIIRKYFLIIITTAIPFKNSTVIITTLT